MKINNFDNYVLQEDGKVIGARGKALKPDINSCGYERVSLSKGGKVTRRFVHQLVAEHFHNKPEGNYVVNHIDGDKRNNHYTNLEWVTPSENVKDGFRRGRKVHNKYTESFVFVLRSLYRAGHSIKTISRQFGKDRNTVGKYVKV